MAEIGAVMVFFGHIAAVDVTIRCFFTDTEEGRTMTKEEQETIVVFDRASSMLHIYTADPALMRRLNGLQSYRLVREHQQGGKVIAAEYEAEKRLLTLRNKAFTSNMSNEQRAAARQRLQEYRKQEKAI